MHRLDILAHPSSLAPAALLDSPLRRVLRESALYPVFQPIVNLADQSVFAHEALIRGPQGSALHTPDALLRAAAVEHLGHEFETACVVASLRRWGQTDVQGRLFVNLSASALTRLMALRGRPRPDRHLWRLATHAGNRNHRARARRGHGSPGGGGSRGALSRRGAGLG